MQNTPSCLAWLCGRGQAAPGGLAHIISCDPPPSPSLSVLAKVAFRTTPGAFCGPCTPNKCMFFRRAVIARQCPPLALLPPTLLWQAGLFSGLPCRRRLAQVAAFQTHTLPRARPTVLPRAPPSTPCIILPKGWARSGESVGIITSVAGEIDVVPFYHCDTCLTLSCLRSPMR